MTEENQCPKCKSFNTKLDYHQSPTLYGSIIYGSFECSDCGYKTEWEDSF